MNVSRVSSKDEAGPWDLVETGKGDILPINRKMLGGFKNQVTRYVILRWARSKF